MTPALSTGRRGTILVVDDEAMIRALTQRILEREGFDVVVARNGLEAIELFARRCDAIDAVVLDLEMPLMNGEAALAVIRIMRGDVPAIVTSGLPPEEIRGRLAGFAAIATLHKPYPPEDLLRAVGDPRRRVSPAATRLRANAPDQETAPIDHAAHP